VAIPGRRTCTKPSPTPPRHAVRRRESALWALELADGAKCRLRNGGARGGRADNYVGDYSCDRSDEVVLVKDDQYQAVTKSSPVWTVLVGHLGNADEVFPAPKKVRVVTAYFATAP
jgi:hypothetical protein